MSTSATELRVGLLKSFIRLNKLTREKKAIKEGFKNAADYIDHLSSTPSKKASPKTTKAAKPTGKTKITTIHVVDILDRSGSMSGLKIQNAVEFINKGVDDLKTSKEKIDYTHTLCVFNHLVDLQYVSQPAKKTAHVAIGAGGTTALYDAVGTTLTKMKHLLKDDSCKVLVNIYTDGEENCSSRYTAASVGKLIEEYNNVNFTITFVGTPHDVATVIKKTKVRSTNTLSYDGSGQGLKKALDITLQARGTYFAMASVGEDVSEGFYKDIK